MKCTDWSRHKTTGELDTGKTTDASKWQTKLKQQVPNAQANRDDLTDNRRKRSETVATASAQKVVKESKNIDEVVNESALVDEIMMDQILSVNTRHPGELVKEYRSRKSGTGKTTARLRRRFRKQGENQREATVKTHAPEHKMEKGSWVKMDTVVKGAVQMDGVLLDQ